MTFSRLWHRWFLWRDRKKCYVPDPTNGGWCVRHQRFCHRRGGDSDA